jgi:hypothetical protein
MLRFIDELAKEKTKLEKCLEDLKEHEAQKLAMRSGAVNAIIE